MEELGPISAAAGGSSVSASVLLLESIQSNPLITGIHCKKKGKGDLRQRARISFLLKSVEEIHNIIDLVNPYQKTADKVLADVMAANLPARMEAGDPTALFELLAILEDPEVASLINPEFQDLLMRSPDPLLHAEDAIAVLQGFDFTVDGPEHFVRPVPISVEGGTRNQGAIASFYAGYEPVDTGRMDFLLEECAMSSLGKKWSVARDIRTSSGETCGTLFCRSSAELRGRTQFRTS